MSHVFISYVHENERIVDRLYRGLTAKGVRVWVDRNDIAPGTLWEDAIRKAISEGDFFVACFSKEYNDRKQTYMNEELNLAIDELRKRPRNRSWFIPVILSGEVPDWEIGGGKTLRSLQWVELKGNKWDIGLQHILKAVKPQKARSIASDHWVAVPVLGFIRTEKRPKRIADMRASRRPFKFINLNAELFNNERTDDLFALIAKGNVLEDSSINDGDTIIVRKQSTAMQGELVLVWLNNKEKTMLRRIYRVRGRIRLQPANPTYRPTFEKPRDVEVQGKVILIVRKLN